MASQISRPWLVIIGPAGAGKTSIGLELSRLTGREFVDIDEIGEPFYQDVGWTMERLIAEIAQHGRLQAERNWEIARAYAVERVMESSHGKIVALGAGHTNYTDPALFAQAGRAINTAHNVLWIQPDEDPRQSIKILRERAITERQTDYMWGQHDIMSEWINGPSAGTPTHLYITNSETVQQSAQAIYTALIAN